MQKKMMTYLVMIAGKKVKNEAASYGARCERLVMTRIRNYLTE